MAKKILKKTINTTIHLKDVAQRLYWNRTASRISVVWLPVPCSYLP